MTKVFHPVKFITKSVNVSRNTRSKQHHVDCGEEQFYWIVPSGRMMVVVWLGS